MLITIDIGNSNIVVGFFRGKRLSKTGRIETDIHKKASAYAADINLLAGRKAPIEGAIICSVVPQVLPKIKTAVKRLFGITPLVVGEDVKAPIKNLYRKPEQVGQDRLLNGVAGSKICGAPLIIVDFGTATTFDFINKKGEYEGGLITPGIDLAIEALHTKTALLPRITFASPKQLLGKDTVNSIRSGMVYGFSSLVDGLVNKMKIEFGPGVKVIATGGYSPKFALYSKTIKKVDLSLTLQGLRLTYELNFGEKG